MKACTFCGTSLGEGYTAWISCSGRLWPLSTSTIAPEASESAATYHGSAAMPMFARAAASTADRLLDRSRAVICTVDASPRGDSTRQTSLPCTLL